MTSRKFIEDMNREELAQVFAENSELQNEVLDDMIESEMDFIGEKLDYVRAYLRDYSVGTGARPYILVRDGVDAMRGFLQGMKDMDGGVPAFNDTKAQEVIASMQKALDDYFTTDCRHEDYEELEEIAMEAIQDGADALAEEFRSNLDYLFGYDEQLDYFFDFYVDARMFQEETYYVIVEEGTSELYKDVNYTKSLR